MANRPVRIHKRAEIFLILRIYFIYVEKDKSVSRRRLDGSNIQRGEKSLDNSKFLIAE